MESSNNTSDSNLFVTAKAYNKEQFYTQKRGIFRKAEQFEKKFDSDLFIVVH
jgi:hypothetical protein